MNREQAWTLLQEHLHNKNLVKHSLAVEACMRAAAIRFGADPETWGLAGLLHDLDYEYTVNQPDQHTHKTAEILVGRGIDPAVIHAIQAHNHRVVPTEKIDHSLLAIDPTTGFIIACVLMHPEKKMSSLDLSFMKKRFKEKSFAKGASRDQMSECRRLEIELDDFLQLCLQTMQTIHADLGF